MAILSKILDRLLRSVDVRVETAVQNFIAAGIPAPIAAAVGESYQSVRNSRIAAMKDGVERVTDRENARSANDFRTDAPSSARPSPNAA